MNDKRLIISFFLVFFSTLIIKSTALSLHMMPKNAYANEKILVSEPNLYKLYWNYSETEIIYELMIKESSGWFFFGFTSNDSLIDGMIKIYKNKKILKLKDLK